MSKNQEESSDRTAQEALKNVSVGDGGNLEVGTIIQIVIQSIFPKGISKVVIKVIIAIVAVGGVGFLLILQFLPKSTEYKVDPAVFNKPVPNLAINKGDHIEIIPEENFKWDCDGYGKKIFKDSNGNIEGSLKQLVGASGTSQLDVSEKYREKYLSPPPSPFCSLIAHVGSGVNGKWKFVGGTDNTFVAEKSGKLYLTANDVKPEHCIVKSGNRMACYKDNEPIKTNVTINITKGEN